jgi:hypothetical protein
MEDEMKKILSTIFAVAMLVLFTVPAFAANYDYYAAVYKKTNTTASNNLTQLTTGITFKVLDVDTNTGSTLTLFGDNKGTSLTNPVTAAYYAASCGGVVKFRNTGSTVDIIVTDTNGGYTAVVRGLSPYDHTIIIDETPNIQHHGIIWFESGHVSNTETDTGVDFLADTFIQDVRPEIVTVVSGKLLSVGLLSTETSGSATGLRTGVLMTTAGYVKDTGVVTNGSSLDYTAASTYGAMLYTAITGSDSVTAGGGRSYLGHVVTGTNAHSLVFTADTSTGDGYIHYFFTRLR